MKWWFYEMAAPSFSPIYWTWENWERRAISKFLAWATGSTLIYLLRWCLLVLGEGV